MGGDATRHLVLVHGGGVGPWMWRRVAEELTGFEIHSPELPGHGVGRRPFTTMAEAARDVAARIRLDELDGEVVVAGFSAGGQVAVELAAQHPDRIAGVCIVSSLLEPVPGGRVLAAVAAAAGPLARSRCFARLQARQLQIPDDDLDAYVELSRTMSTRSLRNLLTASFTFRAPDAFRRHHRPLLLVAGSREQAGLLTGMRRLSAEAPAATLVVREGAGHGIPLAEPARFAALLSGWLGERPA